MAVGQHEPGMLEPHKRKEPPVQGIFAKPGACTHPVVFVGRARRRKGSWEVNEALIRDTSPPPPPPRPQAKPRSAQGRPQLAHGTWALDARRGSKPLSTCGRNLPQRIITGNGETLRTSGLERAAPVARGRHRETLGSGGGCADDAYRILQLPPVPDWQMSKREQGHGLWSRGQWAPGNQGPTANLRLDGLQHPQRAIRGRTGSDRGRGGSRPHRLRPSRAVKMMELPEEAQRGAFALSPLSGRSGGWRCRAQLRFKPLPVELGDCHHLPSRVSLETRCQRPRFWQGAHAFWGSWRESSPPPSTAGTCLAPWLVLAAAPGALPFPARRLSPSCNSPSEGSTVSSRPPTKSHPQSPFS